MKLDSSVTVTSFSRWSARAFLKISRVVRSAQTRLIRRVTVSPTVGRDSSVTRTIRVRCRSDITRASAFSRDGSCPMSSSCTPLCVNDITSCRSLTSTRSSQSPLTLTDSR
ncbi:hypothetical protein STENM223S_11800 [Streptomyces tendae]